MINFIHSWVQDHFYDFTNDPGLLETLKNFLNTTVASSNVNWASIGIKNIIEHHVQMHFFLTV